MGYPSWLSDYLQTQLQLGDHHTHKFINRSQVMVIVGQLFEHISQQLFLHSELSKQPTSWDYYPDLIIWNKRHTIIIETKGTSAAPLIDHKQLLFYQSLETTSPFPFTSPKVFYIIFRYKEHGKLSSLGNIYSIVEYIISHIESAYIFPIEDLGILCSSLHKVYSYGDKWCCKDRDRRDQYIRFPYSFSNTMFNVHHHIIPFIESILNISFKHSYRMIKSPSIKILEFPAFQFPIVLPKSIIKTKEGGLRCV